uniref:Protein decapping 5-like n=1 Tax=Nelumbo nucifera TaxID=4432 RepID=A0A822XYE1_NELNU|nr:TPA_asm: hypothetical protein HUJ06_026496 [Nelumbo nucifera]
MAEQGTSADSYIGSLISLTSKYEIRYEGVLYSINTEESTIGLQNVRSYGTEGRKKDGPQVPPSDKVYEYILFRGSDIKDLQVKSSPPVRAEQMDNDPAIIQSRYVYGPSSSSASASTGGGTRTDLSSQGESSASAFPRTACPTALSSSYHNQTHFDSWASSSSSSTQHTNGSSLSMPMYWQGYYGSLNNLSHTQPQSMPSQSPSTMSDPLMLQNKLQYPELQVPLSTGVAKPVPPLIPTSGSAPSNLSPTLTPQFSTSPTDKSSLSIKASLPSHASSITGNLLTAQDISGVPASTFSNAMSAQSSNTSVQSLPYSASSASGSTSGSLLTKPFTLLTPDQLAQPGPLVPSTSQKLYPEQKIEGLITMASKPLSPVSSSPLQEPLLPLPLSPQQPVYVKDEFFDTLSCNSLSHGAKNERPKFSERMKLDIETFGDFQQRPRLSRGGRGSGRGRHYRGSHNWGRGYGYGGRGRSGYTPL